VERAHRQNIKFDNAVEINVLALIRPSHNRRMILVDLTNIGSQEPLASFSSFDVAPLQSLDNNLYVLSKRCNDASPSKKGKPNASAVRLNQLE
jgi:hypothetical protein